MLYDILIFLPVFACLFWIAIYFTVAHRTDIYRLMLTLLSVAAIYFFTDSCYASPNTPQRMLVYSAVLAQFTAPSIIPLIWMLLKRLRGIKKVESAHMLWMVYPAMLGATAAMITLLEGPDRILGLLEEVYAGRVPLWSGPDASLPLRAYYYVTTIGMRSVLLAETLIYGTAMIVVMLKDNLRYRHLWKYSRGERIRVVEALFFIFMQTVVLFIPKMLFVRTTLMVNPWISAILSVLITTGIFSICRVAMFSAPGRISRREISNSFMYNYNEDNKEEIQRELIAELLGSASEETIALFKEQIRQGEPTAGSLRPEPPADVPGSVAAGIFSAVAKSWDDDSLLSRFERLMLRDQTFLEPGLTLSDIASRLHSNKTYISRLVNNTYNMPFPDLLNTLRVNYAKQYIVQHRDAKQQEIAAACGFVSASAFNNTFKKITGMTPRIWVATASRHHTEAK